MEFDFNFCAMLASFSMLFALFVRASMSHGFHQFCNEFCVFFEIFVLISMVLHPIGDTLQNTCFYITFAWFTLLRRPAFFIKFETCVAAVCCIIVYYMLHKCWGHFGILLASKLQFVRYRNSSDFLICFSTPFAT